MPSINAQPNDKPLQVTVTSFYQNRTTTTTYYNGPNPHCAPSPSKTPEVVIVPKPTSVDPGAVVAVSAQE